jgi:predicted amidophosphoribosyltransferase
MNCEYCQSRLEENAARCPNCGAPLSLDSAPPDYSVCPACHRKLIALGSPACNYCGKRLPASYLKAREAALERISEINAQRADAEEIKIDEGESDLVKLALNALISADKQLGKRQK